METQIDSSATALFERGWQLLQEALRNRKSGFRTFTLATIGQAGAEARTVVLREVDAELGFFRFNADVRSAKVAELREHPNATALFYDAAQKFQIRARVSAVIHHQDEIAREAWTATALLARRCYLAPFVPSTPLEAFHPNLPEHLVGREPEEAESIGGFDNFSPVRLHVTTFETFSLDYEGHLRVLSSRSPDSGWFHRYLAP
jgi:hypothetical protein